MGQNIKSRNGLPFNFVDGISVGGDDLAGPDGSSKVGYRFSGSGTALRTTQSKLHERVSVKDFGAIGDGNQHPLSEFFTTLVEAQASYPHVTSLTQSKDWAAFQAAVNYITNIPRWDNPFERNTATNRPNLFIPAGTYLISDTVSILSEIKICGEGLRVSACILDSASDIPLFEFGVFNTTITDPWTNGGNNVRWAHIADLTLGNNYRVFPASISSKGYGIRAPATEITVARLSVSGFNVGILSPYGNHFSYYDDVSVFQCYIGIYHGIGGQQTEISRAKISDCTYGIILDKPGQILLTKPAFMNCSEALIRIEAYTTPGQTRFATCQNFSGTLGEGLIVVESGWFEAGSGGADDALKICTHCIELNNLNVIPMRGPVINDSFFALGASPTKRVTSVIGATGTNFVGDVKLNDPVLYGEVDNWFYKPGTSWGINNLHVTSGYRLPVFSDTGYGTHAVNRTDYLASTLPHIKKDVSIDGGAGIHTYVGINGELKWGEVVSSCNFVGTITGPSNNILTVISITNGVLAIGDVITFSGQTERSTLTILSGSGNTWTLSVSGNWAFNVSERPMVASKVFYRIGFKVGNRRLFLGDPGTDDFSISRSGVVPTSGVYAAGSFVYNTNPSVVGGKTLLGWQRLTTGSSHVLGVDWSLCYVSNS